MKNQKVLPELNGNLSDPIIGDTTHY